MAMYVIEDTTLTGIADAIREKTETTEDIPALEMRPKILGITSGGMTASIFVTGLSESDTVTASSDYETKIAVWNSTENRHEITGISDKGMWTVTATNGEDTVEQDVLIDIPADFEIEMSHTVNYLMLYDYGDECEDITGGWGLRINAGYNDSSAIAKNAINTEGYSSFFLNAYWASTEFEANLGTQRAVFFGNTRYSIFSGARVHTLTDTGTEVVTVSAIAGSHKTQYAYKNEDNIFLDAGFIYASGVTVTLYNLTLLKLDDWQTLCAKVGISAPADLATLIADTASITAILANENAVKYMIYKCTGDFMASFVSSADCLSALNASQYKSVILANKHWAKFLNMVGVTA